MVEYQDVVDFLDSEYPDREDVVGLLTDLLNGGCTIGELQIIITEYKEHNG